ncbi:MAG: Heteropolysaccharide repeat unit export protein [Candidatus Magasanikbacteria bacterium GW2011_GWD2_43_18]|uniref:Heteropolysaccharide repeat unit export protein n=1 Tax=Candidatus Magasanikbacteria bacterium GW2011_GWE2_42_7 TaxID=1619052 RepID=A0A0G1EC69_9BACT|nr:MAG: Heteropolysaccharide repeat unit export protein [Candidatus Magasanikbacteria bacterium GW2011_GWC2_42_27]KKS72188.1 MAG: Heteropolysaccharide repeat unit export protein [Candidatus Magasanikbacteria bacterium GW2011_GWE2_42_7]KKT04915.1 MAG: Heteropolysaccharide repeat unit export protein [Candidatus Magasanikbacteria bacterium GW2011_GWD2_43_18]KKT25397.1 MAG: Heteropolysaccharide repeat unit export protein [Candidatus Magasanikbacteria bacterium GW2011_GWA2_43_9]HBB37808.1 hypothetic
MSTTRKIAHNTAAQLIGKIVSTGLGLVAIGMMTRYLGTEQFGWYVTTIAFLQFLAILIDFGLIPVTAQMMGEKKIEEQTLLQNLLGYRFVTAIFFLALAPAIALFFPYPHEVKIAIAFTTVNMLAVAMNQIFTGYYQAKLKMHIQAIGEVIGRVVLVGGLALMLYTDAGFLPVMIVLTLASVAYTAYMWSSAFRMARPIFAFDMPIWKEITRKMWPIAISIIFNVMYLKGDTVILSLYQDQTQVGIYGAAYRVIDILAQMAMMMMGLMLPLLANAWAEKNKERMHHLYQQSFDMMMLFAVPLVLGGILVATPIMTLVAGAGFEASGPMLSVLLGSTFFLFIGAIYGHIAVAIDKQKQTMWIYISNAVITVIGYFYFIPRYGLWGAAGMTLFSEAYAGIMLLFTVRKYLKLTLNIQTFGKILFSAIVMAAAIYLFKDWHVLILLPLGGVVYLAFLFGLGAVSKETMKEILNIKS